ncbi:MAG: AmmeMemoRadiSam system protein B [Halopseudomonas sp.]
MTMRLAAVAGIFYPEEPQALRQQVDGYLKDDCFSRNRPKAIVVPHAGFKYSAEIAASAYRLIKPLADRIERVVLLGPAHRVALDGMALPESERFATPLGEIDIDAPLVASLRSLPQVTRSNSAHAQEHCIEVQLPFLQQLIPRFTILPLVVGRCTPQEVVEVLERVWGGDETLLVFSSDLSHYLSYTQARQTDSETCKQLCRLEGPLHGEQACGSYALNGLIEFSRNRGLHIDMLDLRNSGDTAGDKHRVVGYGAFAVY